MCVQESTSNEKRGQAETLENINIKGQQLVMTAEKEEVRKETGESGIAEAKKKVSRIWA